MNTHYVVRRLTWRWLPVLNDLRLHLQHVPRNRGMETLNPQAAVDRYLAALDMVDYSIRGKRVFILGYGGNFAVACKLLEAGAKHVTLFDPYRKPDNAINRKLLDTYARYLECKNGQVTLRPGYITLYESEIGQIAKDTSISPYDLVISSSVFEHIENVDGTIEALGRLTTSDGLGLHFIDLRDHLYTYPFEMLCYSSFVWRYFLNPLSYLNRYRTSDFRRMFFNHYSQVDISIEKSDEQLYRKVSHRVRPEFKTGNIQEDSATYIKVMTWLPRSKSFLIQIPEKSFSYERV